MRPETAETLLRKALAWSTDERLVNCITTAGIWRSARIREWAAEVGEPIGVQAAEGLRLIVIEGDEDEGPSKDGTGRAETTEGAAAE